VTTASKRSDILKAVRAVKGVLATRIDGNILCCVMLTLLRQDQIDSGHMRVNIPRYYTFSHMVWIFPNKIMTPEQEATAEFWDKTGANYFVTDDPKKAAEIVVNIQEYIAVTRECPKDAYLVD
jgi:hypothetical protein